MDAAVMIVSGNRVHRPLMDTVNDDDWEKARVELNETPETRTELLRRFRERLMEETRFRPRIEDAYLLSFLRVRKFDLDRAYQLLRNHYQFRAANPDVFPAPSTLVDILRADIFNYLPHRDHMGRAIFLVKMRNWNADVVSYEQFVAAGNIVSEYVLDNPVTQINGYIGVWDFKGFNVSHFIPFCKPSNMKLLARLMQEIFPGRFKIAYCINCHRLVKRAWNLFKFLLVQKFRNRVMILGSDMNELHQYVDQSILPVEYGGTRPSWPCDEIVQRVIDKEEDFNYNRSFGYRKENVGTAGFSMFNFW